MTARALLAAAIVAALAGPAAPGAPAASARPAPRPDAPVVVLSARGSTDAPATAAVARAARPVARVPETTRAARRALRLMGAATPHRDAAGRVRVSARPASRPPIVAVAARTPRRGGGTCGRASIVATPIGRVPGRLPACGIAEAVRVSAVSGVRLSTPARMDCGTARALDDWVRDAVVPTVGRRGGGAVALRVVAGYACRPRNNRAGARISEHGKGRAIDIAGIRLADGTELTVLTDWNRGGDGRILRQLWRAACGPFGTVLGPDANRAHRDHFHFDTARYRSGSYCR